MCELFVLFSKLQQMFSVKRLTMFGQGVACVETALGAFASDTAICIVVGLALSFTSRDAEASMGGGDCGDQRAWW